MTHRLQMPYEVELSPPTTASSLQDVLTEAFSDLGDIELVREGDLCRMRFGQRVLEVLHAEGLLAIDRRIRHDMERLRTRLASEPRDRDQQLRLRLVRRLDRHVEADVQM